jgi:hypothetical protein
MRHLLFAMLLAASASLAAEQPTAILHPLEVTPNPALTEPAESLQRRFLSVAREHAGYLLLLRKEVETALKDAGTRDYARSDDALAQLAGVAKTQFALYVRFTLNAKNELVLEGRVVKASGERVAAATLVQPRGSGSLLDALSAAVPAFFQQLRKAPPVAAPEVPVATVEPVPPPPPLTDPVVVEQPAPKPTSSLRTTGFVLAGVGAVGAAVGAIVFATAGTVQRDEEGNILKSDADRVTPIRTQQGVGLGVLAAGGALAITGAVFALIAPSAPVTAAVHPSAEGALLTVGGRF